MVFEKKEHANHESSAVENSSSSSTGVMTKQHSPINSDPLPGINTTTLTGCQLECRVTNGTLPPFQQHVDLAYGKDHARVLFVLGYPFTGTSASHFLLSTSGNISTLRPDQPTLVASIEEGFELLEIKAKTTPKQRWDKKLDYLNWTNIAVEYGRRWNLSRPILLENSPPEIQAPDKLKAAFEPMYGKVKFILLVRSDCTHQGKFSESYRMAGYRKVVNQFPQDTFVLRYEDLCLRWEAVFSELVQWEPLLSDIDISAIPGMSNIRGRRRARGHSHAQKSIQEYCKSVLTKWDTGLSRRQANVISLESLTFWGYDKANTC